MLLLLTAFATATTLELPSGEAPAVWETAARMAGLSLGNVAGASGVTFERAGAQLRIRARECLTLAAAPP